MVRWAKNDDGLLFSLTLLTCFFIFLELSFFITCNKVYLIDFKHVAADLVIPRQVWLAIAIFICEELLLHLLLIFIIFFITSKISALLSLNRLKLQFGLLLWLLAILTILLLNVDQFPNSKFSSLLSIIFFDKTITKFTLYSLLMLWFFIGLLTCIEAFLEYPKIMLVGVCSLTIYSLHDHYKKTPTIQDGATVQNPNIIIIGVDALRPDFLSYFGHTYQTSFFDNFLNNAAVFTEAITPLARTFPSWTSVLTGQYPRRHGVRFNLTNPQNIHLKNSLPMVLQAHGYETVYATDETRFSNIDHYFGFDKIITAPMGVNDFIIGTFNDFPLSNLLINTVIGKWLFPYSYGNRGVFVTYEPRIFVDRLRNELAQSRKRPLFLNVHFCVTHFPNMWAHINGSAVTGLALYQASVLEADKQLAYFFNLLHESQLLNHAIVILLSDHGEGLGRPGDRVTEKDLYIAEHRQAAPIFYPPSLDNEAMNESAGHGTDVLGLSQYHVLLAFKLFGLKDQFIGDIPGLVTLIDIKPTVLALLGVKDVDSDGISLAALIQGNKNKQSIPAVKHDYVFLESDYSPASIRTVYPEIRSVMLDGVRLFSIDPISTRLIIKDEMGKMILASKQRAVINNEWMIAIYPQNKTRQTTILVNLKTGEWSDDLQSRFAKRSPAQKLLGQLKLFYGSELTNF